MLYLYAITESLDDPLEAIRGIDYAEISYLHQDGLTAVVSHVDSWTIAPTPRRLWHHEQVVESLMLTTTVLPMRFATIFEDGNTVLGRLNDFKTLYVQNLEELKGCVELSLRVIRLWEPYASGDGVAHGQVPEVAGGPYNVLAPKEKKSRAYDLARRAAALQRHSNRRRNENLAELIGRTLEGFTTDQVVHVEETSGLLVKAAYLVRQECLVDMQHAVRRLIRTYPSLHFLCTGPWPPYHFVKPITPVKKVA